MEPYDLVGALWRQRVLVVLVFLVTAGATVLGVVVAPKTYTATAVMSAAESDTAAVGSDNLDALRGTLGELVSSRTVVEEVGSRLSADYGITRESDALRRSITGKWVDGTILIQIVVTDQSADGAAQIANVVAEVLPLYSPEAGTFLFTTITPARPPVSYSSPNLLLAGGVGLVLASVLACVAAVIRDRRRSTVDNARTAEEAAMAPLLGHVSPPRDLTALPAMYPGTAAADVFRRLRLAMEAEAVNDPVDLIVVAGIGGGEMNVWLGANLAISLAQVGRSVLLVDGRLGAQSGQPLAEPPSQAGLFEVLAGGVLHEALSQGPVENLTVLPAGEGAGSSAATLIETEFSRVMTEAKEQFDVIVVLPPPMDTGDDARVMAAGGSILLALPEGTVSAAALRSYADRTRAVGARLLGVVLVGRRADRGV